MELLQPEPDLQRLTQRWVSWAEEDGRGIGGWTRTALLHLRTHGTPPAEAGYDDGLEAAAPAVVGPRNQSASRSRGRGRPSGKRR